MMHFDYSSPQTNDHSEILGLMGATPNDFNHVNIHPETIYATTVDGWKLALHYWKGSGPRRRLPVVMFHGLGANRLNLHLTERYSVALAVAKRGFDVYVAELRGAGLSRFPTGRSLARSDWGFGDYSKKDVPAIIAKVCQLAQTSQVHSLGHSMGGMVLYAYGSTQPGTLSSICTLGSPCIGAMPLAFKEKYILQLGAKLATEGAARRVPLKTLAGAAGYLGPVANIFVDGTLFNAENIDPAVSLKVIYDATDNIPLNLIAELYQHFSGDSDESSPYSYENQLHKIDVPVFVISGSDDRIAVPESIRAGLERLRSHDIRFRELGRCAGDKIDYGHIDLLVGRYAPQEVYPLIGDYLEEMDSTSI